MPPQPLIELSNLNFDNVIADQEAIRKVNPQRFDMEQLTAIIYADPETNSFAGYKEVTQDEFWVSGHMPDYPLMPGVLICEAAAQLSSWYCVTYNIMGGAFIGFGGLENVRFRVPVIPDCRLLLVGKFTKIHRRQSLAHMQAFVDERMVFEGDIIGTPMKKPG